MAEDLPNAAAEYRRAKEAFDAAIGAEESARIAYGDASTAVDNARNELRVAGNRLDAAALES